MRHVFCVLLFFMYSDQQAPNTITAGWLKQLQILETMLIQQHKHPSKQGTKKDYGAINTNVQQDG